MTSLHPVRSPSNHVDASPSACQVQDVCQGRLCVLTNLVGSFVFLVGLITQSFPDGQHSIPLQLVDEGMCTSPAHS